MKRFSKVVSVGMLACVLLGSAFILPLSVARAEPREVPNPVTSVTITQGPAGGSATFVKWTKGDPGTPGQLEVQGSHFTEGASVLIDVKWAIPDGTINDGDFFTIGLPNVLTGIPATLPQRSGDIMGSGENTGKTFGTFKLEWADSANHDDGMVLKAILNETAAQLQHVSGTIWYRWTVARTSNTSSAADDSFEVSINGSVVVNGATPGVGIPPVKPTNSNPPSFTKWAPAANAANKITSSTTGKTYYYFRWVINLNFDCDVIATGTDDEGIVIRDMISSTGDYEHRLLTTATASALGLALPQTSEEETHEFEDDEINYSLTLPPGVRAGVLVREWKWFDKDTRMQYHDVDNNKAERYGEFRDQYNGGYTNGNGHYDARDTESPNESKWTTLSEAIGYKGYKLGSGFDSTGANNSDDNVGMTITGTEEDTGFVFTLKNVTKPTQFWYYTISDVPEEYLRQKIEMDKLKNLAQRDGVGAARDVTEITTSMGGTGEGDLTTPTPTPVTPVPPPPHPRRYTAAANLPREPIPR